MGLTIKEQIAFRVNQLPSIAHSVDLFSYQTALAVALEWQTTGKTFDTAMEHDAYMYVTKMSDTIGRIYNKKEDMIPTLGALMSAALGNSAYTAAQIESATEEQVEGFFRGEMLSVIENLALVTPSEKAKYDAV